VIEGSDMQAENPIAQTNKKHFEGRGNRIARQSRWFFLKNW